MWEATGDENFWAIVGVKLVEGPPAPPVGFEHVVLFGHENGGVGLEGFGTDEVVAGAEMERVVRCEAAGDFVDPEAWTEGGVGEASLFVEFAVGGLLVGFAGLDTTAGSEPEAVGVDLVGGAKEEDAAGVIEDDESGGRAVDGVAGNGVGHR